MRIDLFIQSSKNPATVKNAISRWRICAYNPRGVMMNTKDGLVLIPKATNKRAALMALRDALRRFNKAAVINVYVQDDFVRNMLQMNMPKRWSEHDWKKFRYNRDIQHEDLWREVFRLLSSHAVRYATAEEVAENKNLKEMEEKNGRK